MTATVLACKKCSSLGDITINGYHVDVVILQSHRDTGLYMFTED